MSKKVPTKAVLITAVLVVLVLCAAVFSASSSRSANGSQPIIFSHKLHAGEYEISCQYCHIYARRAAVAGIPSVERCIGCHKITAAGKPEVQKLQGYWNRKEPVQWTKVTSMPDFVYFEHWPHLEQEIRCQTCHGPVERMDELEPVEGLRMRECLACHREEKASIDCVVCHR